MVFELGKALEAIRFAEGLMDSATSEEASDVNMKSLDIAKYQTIIFRNNSYLEIVRNANAYRVLMYVLKSSILFITLALFLTRWFCDNLLDWLFYLLFFGLGL